MGKPVRHRLAPLGVFNVGGRKACPEVVLADRW